MTKEKLWEMFCNAKPLQRQAACETLLGQQSRQQYPLTEDAAICFYGWHPYEDDSLIKRLHRIAVEVKPSYLPDLDLTLIASAGYQLGMADGVRKERARKKANVERLEAVHADLNNNTHKERSVSL